MVKINQSIKKIPSYFLENPNIFGTLAKNNLNRKREEHTIQI